MERQTDAGQDGWMIIGRRNPAGGNGSALCTLPSGAHLSTQRGTHAAHRVGCTSSSSPSRKLVLGGGGGEWGGGEVGTLPPLLDRPPARPPPRRRASVLWSGQPTRRTPPTRDRSSAPAHSRVSMHHGRSRQRGGAAAAPPRFRHTTLRPLRPVVGFGCSCCFPPATPDQPGRPPCVQTCRTMEAVTLHPPPSTLHPPSSTLDPPPSILHPYKHDIHNVHEGTYCTYVHTYTTRGEGGGGVLLTTLNYLFLAISSRAFACGRYVCTYVGRVSTRYASPNLALQYDDVLSWARGRPSPAVHVDRYVCMYSM